MTALRAPRELGQPRSGSTRRNDGERGLITLDLETITPILGGAPRTRTVDTVDVIRVPTIRGHLRFWWRALQTRNFAEVEHIGVQNGTAAGRPTARELTASQLFAVAEAELWGRAADDSGDRSKVDDSGGRSKVEVRVENVRAPPALLDRSDINANAADGYALWPARKTEKDPAAPRWKAGVRFRLRITAPKDDIAGLRAAVRAWVLFGGYGSRTRRGVGALNVVGDRRARAEWLPDADDPEELAEEFADSIEAIFGRNIFNGPAANPVPSLAGATLLIGDLYPRDPQRAWEESLRWLRDFRQRPGFAREPGSGRPGQSRWPEADKLRHLSGQYGHPARYDNQPAWPRAVFGLPIVGKFIGRGEPPDFELIWHDNRPNDTKDDEHDRMASPLIIKPLATMQGFRPCALWLARPDPPGRVALRGQPLSSAAFGYVGSPADRALHAKLRGPLGTAISVQDAFLRWVASQRDVVRVAP